MAIIRGSLALASDTNRTRGNKALYTDFNKTQGAIIYATDMPFRYTTWKSEPIPPASGTTYTWTYTVNNTQFRTEWNGTLSYSGGDDKRVSGGFDFYVTPNATVKITWSGNEGQAYTDKMIGYNGTNTWRSGTFTNVTNTFTVGSDGKFSVFVHTGNPNYTTQWFSISKIVVNNVRVFPYT